MADMAGSAWMILAVTDGGGQSLGSNSRLQITFQPDYPGSSKHTLRHMVLQMGVIGT